MDQNRKMPSGPSRSSDMEQADGFREDVRSRDSSRPEQNREREQDRDRLDEDGERDRSESER